MDRTFEIKNVNKNYSAAAETYNAYVFAVFSFVFLNSVKIVLFNFLIMENQTFGTFFYKFIYTTVICILLYRLIFRFKSKLPFLIFYLAQAIYIISNLCYFNYFHNYLHLFQFAALFTEGVGAVKHFTIPIDYNLIIVLIDLPVFIYLISTYGRISSVDTCFRKYRNLIMVFPVLLIFFLEVLNFFNNISVIQIAKNFSVKEAQIVERYGTIANNICDIVYNRGGKNLITLFSYGDTVRNTSSSSKNPNFVIIQVESMDSNVVNKKYNGQYIAPYLHKLSQESIYYPYALSYHKSGGTSDSEFSIINCVEPLGNFPSIKLSSYDYPNSMVKRLSDSGYGTFAFHGNIGNYYNRDVAFPRMGFKEFYDIGKMGFEDVGWGAPDHSVFDYSMNKLKKTKGPFLSYIITMSSHGPFSSVDSYYHNKLYEDMDNERVKNYFNSISYVDESIKNFVHDIQANFSNTYIFILGDHTPDIDETEYKQASYISGKDYFEFVPLIIITPDKKVHLENNAAASFLDISPTILSASGIAFSIQSKGINLIKHDGEYPRIPFKGNDYDRIELYERIRELN